MLKSLYFGQAHLPASRKSVNQASKWFITVTYTNEMDAVRLMLLLRLKIQGWKAQHKPKVVVA